MTGERKRDKLCSVNGVESRSIDRSITDLTLTVTLCWYIYISLWMKSRCCCSLRREIYGKKVGKKLADPYEEKSLMKRWPAAFLSDTLPGEDSRHLED